MSHRAIQRLRKDRDLPELPPEEEEESDEEEEFNPKKAAFAFMMEDSDSEDDAESSTPDEEGDIPLVDKQEKKEEPTDRPKKSAVASKGAQEANQKDSDQANDFDTLLEEFKTQDQDVDTIQDSGENPQSSYYDIITSSIEIRDLDIDYVMRTSLLGSNEDSSTTRTNRRGRQTNVFGPPRDNWPRPPHYVGGGIGMTTHHNQDEHVPLPWPYNEMKEGDDRCPAPDRWFQFMYSDSYIRDHADFERIKASGDPNALALFIAHHPFVVEALLQLSSVLYQTNQSQEGLSLLKRALFVYECSSANSFLKIDGRLGFMDYEHPVNSLFFDALFLLIRVSRVAGLSRASFASSRFLLSLDPLRDPTNILLALDHFALISNNEANAQWVVDFAESNKVGIFHKDDTNEDGYECSLLDLPNWSYSYALALFRIHHSQPSEDSEERAKSAMKKALSRFPSVLEELLVKNEVNTSGRSFQTDWPSVLEFARERSTIVSNTLSDAASADPVVKACTKQAYGLIVRIFVQQNFKLWSLDAVLSWMYQNLKELKESKHEEDVHPLSPALMRYARCDPGDYEDKFQTMPADANPLDPGLVAHALTVDTNRPRFMQRTARGGGMQDELQMMGGVQGQGAVLAGAPTEMIDPDWPILEVFWRSALPWAHVEGVPPPQR